MFNLLLQFTIIYFKTDTIVATLDKKLRGVNIMKSIKAITGRNLISNFKSIVDEINEYDTTVIVTRPNHKNIVIISQKEYDSWQETFYLLGTEANRMVLMKAKKSFKSNNPKNKLFTPEEFEKSSQNK